MPWYINLNSSVVANRSTIERPQENVNMHTNQRAKAARCWDEANWSWSVPNWLNTINTGVFIVFS